MVHQTLTPEQADNRIFNIGMGVILALTVALTTATVVLYLAWEVFA